MSLLVPPSTTHGLGAKPSSSETFSSSTSRFKDTTWRRSQRTISPAAAANRLSLFPPTRRSESLSPNPANISSSAQSPATAASDRNSPSTSPPAPPHLRPQLLRLHLTPFLQLRLRPPLLRLPTLPHRSEPRPSPPLFSPSPSLCCISRRGVN